MAQRLWKNPNLISYNKELKVVGNILIACASELKTLFSECWEGVQSPG